MSPCVRERRAGPKPTENRVARMPDGLGREEVPELVDEDQQQQAADRERGCSSDRLPRTAHGARARGPTRRPRTTCAPIHERAGLDRTRARARRGRRSPGSEQRPARNADTASSSAAFSAHGARPPASPAARASARQRNVAASAASNVSAEARGQIEPLGRGQPRAVGIGERVGDRHPHVRQAEVGEQGSVATGARARGRSTADGRRPRCARTATPNSKCASMTSRPLFISVAESIVIRAPMSHVGWRSASAGRDLGELGARAPAERPAARRSARATRPRRPIRRASSWCSAECSESTGSSAAPPRRAASSTSGPPATRLSLLASATSMPASSAARVASSPATPTHRVQHEIAPRLGCQPGDAVGALEHASCEAPARARAAARDRRGRSCPRRCRCGELAELAIAAAGGQGAQPECPGWASTTSSA